MPRYLSITITAEVTEEGEAAIHQAVQEQLQQMKGVQEQLGAMCEKFGVPVPGSDGLTPENQALSMMVGLTWDDMKAAAVESTIPFGRDFLVYKSRGFRVTMSAQRTGVPAPQDLPLLRSLSHAHKAQPAIGNIQVPM